MGRVAGKQFCWCGSLKVMKKQRVILLPVAVTAVPGGMIWSALASQPPDPAVPDPVYAGHSLNYWLDPPAPSQVFQMDRLVDSDAIPYLVRALGKRDKRPNVSSQRLRAESCRVGVEVSSRGPLQSDCRASRSTFQSKQAWRGFRARSWTQIGGSPLL